MSAVRGLIAQPCEVVLHLASELVWLHPPSASSVPGQDKLLNGVVEIECPSERVVQGVHVQLIGIQTVGFPQSGPRDRALRWKENKVLERTLKLYPDGSKARTRSALARSAAPVTSDASLFLEKGLHGLEFSFIVPASSPPYERCRFGRTRYFIIATVLGGGRGGTNVTTTREVFFVQMYQLDGGAIPLDIQYQDVHETLTFVSIAVSTSSLTVGGILNFAVVHPYVPPNVNVHLLRIYVEQNYEIYDRLTDRWGFMPPEKLRVWEIGVPPPRTREENQPSYWAQGLLTADGVQNGTRLGAAARNSSVLHALGDAPDAGYHLKTVVRMPNDHRLRPTTARGTRTDLRVSHELGVEFVFSRPDVLDERSDSDMKGLPKMQVFTMSKSITVQTCEFTYDAIHLPPYSQESPVASQPISRSASGIAHPSASPWRRQRSSLSNESEWNRLVQSLSHLTTGTRSLASSRESSPCQSRVSSRPASPSLQPPSPGGPVVVRRPNDDAWLPDVRAAPRGIPAGAPWAVPQLPPRTGESHYTCNCGQSTEQLVAAEERLLGGAPTAPGAWIETPTPDAALPPWTPSLRASSPMHEWLSAHEQRAPKEPPPQQVAATSEG